VTLASIARDYGYEDLKDIEKRLEKDTEDFKKDLKKTIMDVVDGIKIKIK
jgi:hypothetical protein